MLRSVLIQLLLSFQKKLSGCSYSISKELKVHVSHHWNGAPFLSTKTKPRLTADNLIRKGYFPNELPPPFDTSTFADCRAILPIWNLSLQNRAKAFSFPIPKSWPARRVHSILNPLHQTMLCATISEHWPTLRSIVETQEYRWASQPSSKMDCAQFLAGGAPTVDSDVRSNWQTNSSTHIRTR